MSINFNGKCNQECKYFTSIATEGHGICQYPQSFIPVTVDSECRFTPQQPDIMCMTCGKDCARWGNDDACFTVDKNDSIVHKLFNWKGQPSISVCAGFEDKLKYKFFEVCEELYHREVNLRRCMGEWIEEFEQSMPNPWNQISEEERIEHETI